MSKRNKLCFLVYLFSFTGIAQSIDLEHFIEQNFDWQDQELPYEDIYESLFTHYTQPLNLNKTSEDNLASLYILSPTEIRSFLRYREEVGALLSLYELQAIPGFDLPLIRKLLPFVTVIPRSTSDKSALERIKSASQSYFLVRNSRKIESSRGFQEDQYLGDKNHLYARLKISSPEDFALGFTIEKDAGEPLLWNHKIKGFDHSSAYIQIQNRGKIKHLIVGDYQLQFGQGLVFGAGFTPGKGAETILTTRRGNAGLKPFSSVVESGFFRGIATSIALGSHQLTWMGSIANHDGNRVSNSNIDEYISSIQTNGLHRTEEEIDRKNELQEISWGANWIYQPTKRLEIGTSLLQSRFNLPIQRKPTHYNQYEFAGRINTIASSYINFNWQNVLFFGETALSSSKGLGTVVGLIFTATDQLDMSIIARNYQPNFNSLYGNAFSEGSRIINEKGVYWGLSYTPNKKHRLNTYYDRFVFPWLRFGVRAPSIGQEWLIRYTFKPNRNSHLYFQLRNEIKQESLTPDGENLSQLVNRSKWQYIINYDLNVNAWLSLKTRMQGSKISREKEKTTGIVLLQDFVVNHSNWKFSTRFALFDTDDFENRQYLYERNVLYAFSIPAYNGHGVRKYLLAEYKLSKNITAYARYARFDMINVVSAGSGWDKTTGNVRSEWNAQLRIRL